MKKSEMTKERILQAAEQEFSANGLSGARIDTIAEKSAANKRMIYAYFQSKEGLYKCVLQNVYARISDLELHVLAKDGERAAAICEIIGRYFAFLQENPTFVNLVMWENLNCGQYIEASDAAKTKEPSLATVRKLLLDGMRTGEFRSDIDVEQALVSLNMFCFSSFSNRFTMTKVFRLQVEERAFEQTRKEHICEMFMRYLQK